MKRLTSYTILLLALVILTSLPCFTQATYEIDKTTRFERIAAEQGLSSKFLTCIHQDKYGFIWIGTQLGLNLYDGYEFKVFKTNPEDPLSICYDHIYNIYEEADGSMWFCTDMGISKFNRANHTFANYTMEPFGKLQHGTKKIVQDEDDFWIHIWHDLYRFNKETGEFTQYAQDTDNPSKGIMGNNSSCILLDRSGVLWIGSGDNKGKYYLSKYLKETGEFIHFQNIPSNPESFNGKEVWSMIEDQDGIIWIATDGGGLLKLIDREKGRFRHYTHIKDDTNSVISNELYSVLEDSKGMIWTGADGGFSIFNKSTEQFTNYPIPPRSNNTNEANKIGIITESNNGNYWMDARKGIFRFNMATKALYHYLHDPENPVSLSSNIVQELLIDQSGQLWVLLINNGLNRLNEFSNAFIQIRKMANADHSLTGNSVGRFYGDSKGNLWIATDGGLNRTKLSKQKTYTHFEHFIRDPNNENSMSSNVIFSMHEDRDKNLWFGTWYGLNKYDYESNSFTQYFHEPEDNSTISAGFIESIYEDTYGTLWFGTRSGLSIYDKKSNKFIRYLHDDADSNSLLSNSVRVILEDSQGELWIGGTYLEKLNRKDTSFIHYYSESDDNDDLYPSEIWEMTEVDSGNIWIQTMRRGFYKFDRNNNAFTRITNKHDLAGNDGSTIETEGRNYIWAPSDQGLLRINTNDYTTKSFDVEDGLTNLEFSAKRIYKDDDGWMYLGGTTGFNLFHPDSIKDNTFIPPVYITLLAVAGQPKYFEKPLYEIQNIELKYFENDLSIEYLALNYINAKKNKYAFMLQGYDEEWRYVDNRRAAYFTNLSPGKYTFKVKASNNDGYWNEKGASLDIYIKPPFWATWWAYIIYFVLFILILIVIIRFYLRRQQLLHNLELKQVESDKLIELDHLKSRFFSNISHEFRTPLTLILGPLEKILKKTSDKGEYKELSIAQRYARQLQALVNQILSLSKLESGNMHLRATESNIVELIRKYLQSFESLAKQKNITLQFQAEKEVLKVFTNREKIEQILNNLLSNAFKYTGAKGTIAVNISSSFFPNKGEHKGIKITISDTGHGIPPEHIEHIFDRFYQAEQTENSQQEGTGIGLALTKELVELHHGKINVESIAGNGSVFSIYLPLGSDHLATDEVIEKEPPFNAIERQAVLPQDAPSVITEDYKNIEETNDTKPILLIVEDNADMRLYIREYFESEYSILEAIDGVDGLNQSIEYIPDIIISDVMMPNMDGNTFCSKVKSDEKTCHIPVILLTARASKEYRVEGLETGADDFITKPFDGEELQVRVKNLIHQRKKLQEHYLKDLKPAEVALSMDEKFLQNATNMAFQNLSNSAYTIEDFAADMALSRNQLHRKLRALVNKSSTEFIRTIRLKYAADLLKKKVASISEIAYDSGFTNPTYFSISFKQQFGMSPSQYQKHH